MQENKKDHNINNTSNQKNNDEIDLIELFSLIGDKIKQFFTGIGQAFVNLLIYFYKKVYQWKLVIGIAVIIGGVVGFLMKDSSQYYSSTATVNSPYLKGVDFITEIDELNSLCTQDGRVLLSKQLNVPLEVAENISEIQTIGYFNKYMKGRVNEEIADSLYLNSLEDESRFEITISTKVNSITKEQLQSGFEYFFEKNKFIQNYQSVYLTSLKEKEEVYLEQRKQLREFNDAYKDIIIAQGELLRKGTKTSSSNVVVMKDEQTDGYIRQSGEKSLEVMLEARGLEDSLKVIRRELSLQKPVEFVNKFSELFTVSLSTRGKTVLGMLFGFLTILGFAVLVDLNDYLKKKANI
ncbi:hypothetical protein [Flammeovirga agarivorans]|uniref:Chain length determinant protein n=1 Tax=Flammeovirga agarivorans TaxID=2726742 RepID=A0A7X8XXB3_9BACT|nr:hypothetical protein [Flammeovirga agarivorans]NLR93079.1 hypothetical protein [Flammeovirga agarivorans]